MMSWRLFDSLCDAMGWGEGNGVSVVSDERDKGFFHELMKMSY